MHRKNKKKLFPLKTEREQKKGPILGEDRPGHQENVHGYLNIPCMFLIVKTFKKYSQKTGRKQ